MTLRCNGVRVHLSSSLIRLLAVFAGRQGDLITREEIAGILWKEPEMVDVGSGINAAIRRLRSTLNDDPAEPKYIETVVGAGYRFVCQVERLSEVSEREQANPTDKAFSTSAVTDREVQGADPAMLTDNKESVSPPSRETSLKRSSTSMAGKEEDQEFVEIDLTPDLFGHLSRSHVRIFASIIILLIFAVLAVVRSHPRSKVHSYSAVESQLAQMSFVQGTFNDIDNIVTAASISHDGRMLAFVDDNGLTIKSLDRNIDRVMSSLPKGLQIETIAWQADDADLLVNGKAEGRRSQIWIVSLKEDTIRVFIDNASDGTPSPDGSSVAFVRGNGGEIWLANSHGGSQKRLVQGGNGESFSELIWAPSGIFLIAQKRKIPDQETQHEFIWDYESFDSRSGKLLSSKSNLQFQPAFFLPDGRLFVTEQIVSDSRSRAVLSVIETEPKTGAVLSERHAIVKFDGDLIRSASSSSDLRTLSALLHRDSTNVFCADLSSELKLENIKRLVHSAPENFPHSWTPDGTAVIFESNLLGAYAIYKQRIDGSPAELLARAPNNGVLPKVSPDGKWILFENFASLPVRRTVAIYRIPIEGGRLERVPTHALSDEVQCSVSSEGICVVRETVGRKLIYYSLDPIKGQGTQLARTDWAENQMGDWGVSPNGRTLAIAGHDRLNPVIRFVSLSGKTTQPVDRPIKGFGTLEGVSWAADGRNLFVESKLDTHYLLLCATPTGKVSVLREETSPIWAVPSRDGKKIAFGVREPNTNVWLTQRSY